LLAARQGIPMSGALRRVQSDYQAWPETDWSRTSEARQRCQRTRSLRRRRLGLRQDLLKSFTTLRFLSATRSKVLRHRLRRTVSGDHQAVAGGLVGVRPVPGLRRGNPPDHLLHQRHRVPQRPLLPRRPRLRPLPDRSRSPSKTASRRAPPTETTSPVTPEIGHSPTGSRHVHSVVVCADMMGLCLGPVVPRLGEFLRWCRGSSGDGGDRWKSAQCSDG
jgi:hypothetical protein